MKNYKAIEKKIDEECTDEDYSPVKGNCSLCGKEVDGRFYCFGCKEFVCDDCDKIDPPMRKHKVKNHKKC